MHLFTHVYSDITGLYYCLSLRDILTYLLHLLCTYRFLLVCFVVPYVPMTVRLAGAVTGGAVEAAGVTWHWY